MNKSSQQQTLGTPILEVIDLAKEYQGNGGVITALRQVSLTVHPGEMAAIMGPSGSGKSTLLFILGLLLSPTGGRYYMLGTDMLKLARTAQAETRRNCIGFVFQNSDMIETCSVYENLELPLIYADVRRAERPERIAEALNRVNMTHRLGHPANRLSGGERQRVGIARALVNRPCLLLGDEPTGQVDRANGQRIMDCFERIADDGKTAVIVVTHDPLVAARCPRMCRLEDGVLYEP